MAYIIISIILLMVIYAGNHIESKSTQVCYSYLACACFTNCDITVLIGVKDYTATEWCSCYIYA